MFIVQQSPSQLSKKKQIPRWFYCVKCVAVDNTRTQMGQICSTPAQKLESYCYIMYVEQTEEG